MNLGASLLINFNCLEIPGVISSFPLIKSFQKISANFSGGIGFKLFPLKVIEKVYELLTQIIHFQQILSILLI
jgi:hypothetical protein